MDVTCPTCGEPYDPDHLREDEAVFWDLAPAELSALLQRGAFSGPDDPARQAAAREGWQFATDSLFSVLRCPSCPKPDAPQPHGAADRREKAKLVWEMLGNDEDGALVHLEGIFK